MKLRAPARKPKRKPERTPADGARDLPSNRRIANEKRDKRARVVTRGLLAGSRPLSDVPTYRGMRGLCDGEEIE